MPQRSQRSWRGAGRVVGGLTRLGGTPAAGADEPSLDLRRSSVLAAARQVGEAWHESPYYEHAEGYTDHVWDHVGPYLESCDFSVSVDVAAGHGRHSTKLLPLARRLYIVDMTPENIETCRRRFGDDPRVRYVLNDGVSLSAIPSESVTLVFCFDAMVHFDSDTVRAYLEEFRRILMPGGRGFCHHSNLTRHPGGDWQANPEWRNFMSRELFAHYAAKAGLRILRSDLVDWAGISELDCYTVFERPPL